MEGAAIFLVLLLVLATAGFGIYVYVDYQAYRKTVDKGLKALGETDVKTAKAIEDEAKERLAKLKSVVKQVNDVNVNIYDTIDAKVAGVQANVDATNATVAAGGLKTDRLMTGMDTFFKFDTTAGTSTKIYDYVAAGPGATTVRTMNLMQHATAVSGLTAKDLAQASGATPAKQVKFCGTGGANPPCIELPNADGNTYLTALASGKKITMGAPVSVSADGGAGNTAAADAAFEILPATGKATLKAGDATNFVKVNADNSVDITNGSATAKLQVDSAGKLVITPPSGGVRIAGAMEVTGGIRGTVTAPTP